MLELVAIKCEIFKNFAKGYSTSGGLKRAIMGVFTLWPEAKTAAHVCLPFFFPWWERGKGRDPLIQLFLIQ